MNTKLEEHLVEVDQAIRGALVNQAEALAKVSVGKIVLSRITNVLTDTFYINAYGGTFWIDVYNREDLQAFMTIAGLWNKKTENDIISYNTVVEGVTFQLRAHDAALPDTCKLVEEEVVVPAQPERIEKRMVVKCAPVTPVAVEPEPALVE